MGSKYANMVISCLTCLDKDNQYFREESDFYDSNGVLIGESYIEQVILELQQIAV